MKHKTNLYNCVQQLLNNRWLQAIFIVIISLVVYFQFKFFGQEATDVFNLGKPWKLFLAFPFVIYSLVAHAFAWKVILNRLGEDLNIFTAIYVYYLSGISRYIPGNYWYIFLRSLIGVKAGINLKAGLKGTGIELVINLTVGMLLALFGTLFGVKLDSQQIKWILLFALISVAFFFILFFVAKKANAKENKTTTFNISSYTSELLWIKNLAFKDLLILILLFSSAWFSQGMGFYFILSAWGNLSLTNIPLIMFAHVTAWVIGFLNPLTPNGLGIRESVFMLAIASIVTMPIGYSASLVMRILVIIGEALLALLGWLIMKKKKEVHLII